MTTTWDGQEHLRQDFAEVDLSDVVFRACHFTECRFRRSELAGTVTESSIFERCDFSGARLNGSVHTGSAFLNCRVRWANMFAAEFRECKMTGSAFDEANLEAVRVVGGDWSYAGFRFQKLSGLDLRRVRLAEADFYECDLTGADLRDADLSHANMDKAQLEKADLRGAVLEAVNLTAMRLRDTRMDLTQAMTLARHYGAIVEFE